MQIAQAQTRQREYMQLFRSWYYLQALWKSKG